MAPRWLEAGAESLENGALGVKNGGRILENGVVNGDRSCLENGVVNGDRSLENGVVNGDRSLENGVVNGDRSLESGVVNGDRSLETGAPSVVNRDFSLDLSVVNGDRSLEAGIVVTGDRSLETGAWSEVNGDRSPRSGARGVGNGDRSSGSGTPRVVNADRSVDLSEVTGDRSVQTGVPSVVNNDLTLQTGAAGVVDNDLTLQTGAAGVVDDIRRPQDHARSLEGARPRRRPASTARKGRSSRTQRGVQASRDSSPEDGGWREGKCGKNSCDMELGCENHGSQDHHRCVCPHDYKPPRRDQKCSRNVVAPHHRAAGVPNIYVMPVGATPGTEASTSRSGARPALTPPPSTGPPHPLAGRGHDTDPGGLGHGPGHGPGNGGGPTAVMESSANLHSILMIVVPILVAFFVAWCVCCRYGRSRKNQTPRSLSKGPLGSELFLPNPQYSVGLAALGDAAHGQQTVVPLIDRRALTLHENIGEGCFGKVFRGELKSADCPGGQTVAVKVLKESATREAEEDFMREVEVMSAFQHPHILRLIGVLPREPQSAPCMVFEFMPFGDLTEVLRCSSKSPWMPPRPGLPPLSQEALLGVALQIALGMRYLANQRFVHRDLACRNCLVGHNLTVKIADFGMSRDVYTCDYYKMGGTRALPVRWMSPEALLYGRFTLESDVWSFGVVLWEVFTRGKLPYYGHANDEALELVLRGVLLPLPEDPACPAAVLDLMRCCWRTEPRDRLRFPEVCSRLEEALEASLREMRLESDALDAELPRPPGFPAVYPDLGLEDLPALPDDLLLLPPPSPAAAAACPGEDAAGRADGCEELQLDPENYLLPRVPDPVRVEYMEPIAD